MTSVTKGKTGDNADLLVRVLENIPIGIMVLDSRGKILRINRWQEKISKVSREKIVGRYFHEAWKRLFDQGIMKPYWDLIHNGKPYEMIIDKIYPQFYDKEITAILRGAPLPHGEGFILLNDVSEEIKQDKRLLDKLTRELSKSNIFLENIIDSSPDAIITIDNDGIIKSFNKTGISMFGHKKAKIIGMDISDLFEEGIIPNAFKTVDFDGKRREFICKKNNGKTFPVRISLTDITKDIGESQGKLMLVTDITEQKNVEEKLALSEKLAVYSELMAGIAHQINNPMVGVINFSSILLDKTDRENPNRILVETIHKATKDCQKMLSSMMACIQEPRINFSKINIRDALESTIQDARDHIKTHLNDCITLSKRIHKGLPTVNGDLLQLRQVFRNVITNAMEALPHGGNIKVRTRIDWNDRELKIYFHDSGFGISEENMARLFIPFFTTKKSGGTGLGLSFAFQMIRNHRGCIEVCSSVNHGSTITVVLPILRK